MSGYMPLRLDQFVIQYIRNNPGADAETVRAAVEDALAAWRQGVRCACGRPLWVAGSAVAGYGCFQCISGSPDPDGDPEITEVCDPYSHQESEAQVQFAEVTEIMKNHPHDYRERLEAIGYVWNDDEHDQLFEEESHEERQAAPQTQNQQGLVHFLDHGGPVTQTVMDAYRTERYAAHPNVPLIRKYFKQANPNLKAILLAGLADRPTDADLLDDLAYFAEFDNMLGELIGFYKQACLKETDMERFSQLAQEFHLNTWEQGFDAMHELGNLFQSGVKSVVVQHLSETLDEYESSESAPF